MAPIASAGTKNQGSGSSGSRARPMLLFPELEAPFSKMMRPGITPKGYPPMLPLSPTGRREFRGRRAMRDR
jgi:hypothetical protein